jgi:hypothetical protein
VKRVARVPRLADRVGALLRRAQPFAYCDDCIARYFSVSPPAARRAAREVGAVDGFMRKTRRCRTCQRMADVTWRTRPTSPWLLAARAEEDF